MCNARRLVGIGGADEVLYEEENQSPYDDQKNEAVGCPTVEIYCSKYAAVKKQDTQFDEGVRSFLNDNDGMGKLRIALATHSYVREPAPDFVVRDYCD